MIVYASSIEQYDNEYVSESIKSLMLWVVGADKWYIIRQPPSCFGTNPNPNVGKLGSGGVGKGPKMRPASQSF